MRSRYVSDQSLPLRETRSELGDAKLELANCTLCGARLVAGSVLLGEGKHGCGDSRDHAFVWRPGAAASRLERSRRHGYRSARSGAVCPRQSAAWCDALFGRRGPRGVPVAGPQGAVQRAGIPNAARRRAREGSLRRDGDRSGRPGPVGVR